VALLRSDLFDWHLPSKPTDWSVGFSEGSIAVGAGLRRPGVSGRRGYATVSARAPRAMRIRRFVRDAGPPRELALLREVRPRNRKTSARATSARGAHALGRRSLDGVPGGHAYLGKPA
jgi:hypothetical protein